MKQFLFEDFDEVSAKQWKQKIQYDLKGADYNETLLWQSPEGIHVKPFYHADDFQEDFQPIPGQPSSWKIAQRIFIDDENIANRLALNAIRRGAEAVIFAADREFKIENVFADFFSTTATVYFDLNFLSKDFYQRLFHFFSEKKVAVYYNIDLIGNLARTGNWYYNLKEDHAILDAILEKDPTENILSVDAGLYQNAGANTVQQLAYALAHANEYLNLVASAPLSGRSLGDAEESTGSLSGVEMTFRLSTGPNYFFEIAKIRALRKLYASLAREYGTRQTCHIIASPTKRNKTLYDYNVNLLRSTTECMSAVLGGADTVCNLPYDAVYNKSNEFSERIARNQLLILKHESYLDAVSNAADGTYYIESLTDELAEKALQLFKEIERNGGFLKQLKKGIIQKKIKESAHKEQQLFDSGALKLLGTNYHPNRNDRMKGEITLFPFAKHNPVKTLISPIVEKRLSEITEQERLNQEV